MKSFLTTVFIFFIAILSAQYVPNFQKHTVKQGETAKTIAAKYKVSFTDFCLLNDFPPTVTVSTGQVVLIRQLNPGETYVEEKSAAPATTTKPAPAKTETATTTTKPTPAKTETATTSTTAKPSAKVEPTEIKSKPVISTPATTTSAPVEKPVVTKADFTGPGGTKYESSGDGYHIVKTGQTFYRIALINGLTVDELKALNNLTNTNVEVGQKLKVK